MLSQPLIRITLLRPFLSKSFTTKPVPPPPAQVFDSVLLSKEKVNHDSYIYK